MGGRAHGGLLAIPPAGGMRPWHRLLLAVEILISYVPLAWALRRRSLPVTLGLARSPRGRRIAVPSDQEHELALRLGHIVGFVLEWSPFDSRCLIRSLVLVRMLARRSIGDAQLVIGTSVDGGFAAHAWVEHDGEPLLPTLSHPPLVHL